MSKRKRTGGVSQVGPSELVMPPVEGAQESLSGSPEVRSMPESSDAYGAPGESITMYTPDGVAQKVDAAQAPELYRQQKLGFADGQKINVTRGGKVYEFTPDKLEAAFDNGYQIASDEQVTTAKERKEFSGLGKTAEAFALGGARGLTFGLSDPLAVGAAGLIGGDAAKEATRRELKLSKEHHEVASVAGEVAGALAPIIASGGTAAAAEGGAEAVGHAAAPSLLRRAISGVGFIPRGAAAAGELAEHAAGAVVGRGAESLAARVAQKAFITGAQAGTEGALFGAGAAVSEATLGNEEINAEKILAGAAHGFKLGAISGGALGGGLELGKAAIDKGLKIIGKEGLESYLNEVANNQTLKAAGVSTRDLRNMGKTMEGIEERKAAIAEEIRGFRFENGKKLFSGTSNQHQLAEGLQEAVDEVGQKLGAFRKKTFALAGEHNISADAEGFFQKFDEKILKPALEEGGTLRTRALKAADEMANVKNRLVPIGLTEEHPLYGVWKAATEGNEAAQNAMSVAVTKDPKLAQLVQPRPVTLEDLTNLRNKFDKILYPERVKGIAPPPPEHMSELLGARRLLEQHIEQATDRVVEQTGNAQVMGAYKTLKDQYRNLSDGKAIAAQAEVIRATARNSASLSDKMAAGAVLSGSLARGLSNPASMAYAGVAGIANHVANTYGNAALANIADKTSKLIALQNHVHTADTHVAEGINAFLGEMHEVHELAHKIGHVGREVSKTGLEVKEHLQHQAAREGPVEQAQQLVSDPHAMATHAVALSAAIAEHAPKTAAAVQERAIQVAQNIAAQAPAGHHADDVLIPSAKPAVSDAEKHRSTVYAEVATKGPVAAVTAMKSGRLTPTHVQAWKENYPNWYEETKQQVVQGVADRNGKVPYEKRKQLGIFLGVPVDGTQTPQFKQSMQSIYAQSQPEQSAPKPSRRPATKLADGKLTYNQNLE